MPVRRKVIGLTGPSSFSQHCMDTVEEFYDANFILLYHGKEENLNRWLKEVDAVILAGGVDIHPTVYNESVWNNHNLSKFDLARDCRELQVIEFCIKSGKPLLGICRGHQLLGIRHGMGFVMDLSNSSICHNPLKAGIAVEPYEPIHSVKIQCPEHFQKAYKMPDVPERKIFREILAEKSNEKIWVNSFHHQGVSYNKNREYHKENIRIIGTSRVDLQSVKEIIEVMEGETWVSVQFHPEYDWKFNTASRVILQKFKSMME